jgi:hypothetical protein
VSGVLETWRRRSAWLLAAGIFLAANGAFFFWYRGTGRDRQEALEARRVALEGEVASAEKDAAHLEGQSRRLSQVSAAIQEFYGKRVGTRRATLAPIVDEIHATLKRAGIAPGQISYGIKAMKKLPLSDMTASFSFVADYARFKRLLDYFETGPRWIVVRDIGISRQTDVPGAVQVRMDVGTYFVEAPEEAPAPHAPVTGSVPAATRQRKAS